MRARLVRDLSKCLCLSKEDTILLCESIENIHHSSILHDDVIDASQMRRNRMATWVKFSKQEAILAGDYLMAQVSFRISDYGNLPLLKLTSTAIKNMVKGEWLQQEQLGRESFATLDQVHIFKTSALFEWCVRAPFLIVGKTETALHSLLTEIGNTFGQLFQRADDAIDFGIRNKESKKEFKDLEEGYLNFFGVYLQENAGIKNKKALRSCRNLSQLKHFIGEKNLQQQIQAFDKMNEQLMSQCYQKIEKLSVFLQSDQQKLISVLQSWIPRLYLR